jgi:membrane protease YdiL (CAAX protease family)
MFCPGCGGEYRAGFSRCIDCELDLVPELPWELEPREQPAPEPAELSEPSELSEPWGLATVFATGDPTLLAQAKSLLDDAGIPYLTRGEGRHDLLAQGRLEPGGRAEPMEIQVRAEQWRKAGALLHRDELEPVEATPEEQLEGGGQGDEEETERAAVAPPPVRAPRIVPAERRQRVRELALVLLVAFSSSFLSSTLDWWTGRVSEAPTVLGSLYGIGKQTIYLGLLAYVLTRRGRTFRDLGLTFRWADIPAGLLLTMATRLAEVVAWRPMDWVSVVVTGHPVASSHHAENAVGLALIMVFLFSAVIDPFFEEMIARAFTMTEIEALTGSTGLAILASVTLQTSYHLYLGTANALSLGAGFLIGACFYARFRRITPVILAHAIWNAYVTLHRL